MPNNKATRPGTKQLWIILAIVFFGFLGLSMPYLIFPPLFLNPSYSILPPEWGTASRGFFLGATLSAYPFGQFLGSPALGALSDFYGRRKLMSVSLLIAAIFSLLTALSLEWNILWLLILSRFLAGLMEGNLAIARAMAADIKHLNKHDTFGKINAAASISFALGPLLGALLSDRSIHEDFTLSAPFFIISGLFLTLSITSFLAIDERIEPVQAPKSSFWDRINFVQRLRVLFRNRQFKLLLIVVSLQTLAIDMFYEFGPVYLTAKWLLGPAQLAVYNGALCLTLTLGSGWIAGRLAALYPNRKILMWSMSALTIALISIVLTIQPLIMLAIFAVNGLAIAITTTNLTVQVSDAVSDEIQGEVMGVQTSIRVLGDAIICLLGGALLSLSPALVLLLAALVSLSSLTYYLVNTRSSR